MARGAAGRQLPRTDAHIDRGDGLRAESHRADRLHPAEAYA